MAKSKRANADAAGQKTDGGGQATSGRGGGVSKTEAVRQALGTLGRSAMPAQIQDYVTREFGFKMSLNHISNIKSGLKGKKGRRGRRKAKAVRAAAAAQPAAAASGNGRHAGGVSFRDIELTKELALRIGPAKLHALIDLVTK